MTDFLWGWICLFCTLIELYLYSLCFFKPFNIPFTDIGVLICFSRPPLILIIYIS
ncbi:hypothetical protein ACJX0J_005462, partial [Zea mays]